MEHCLTCRHRSQCEIGIDLGRTYNLLRHLAPADYRRHTDIIMRRAAAGHCPIEVEAVRALRACPRRGQELAPASWGFRADASLRLDDG